MPQFVLVPSAWQGAWSWARVLPLLRAPGHLAHAVTLTGLGDRAHLLSTDIRLETHITDVLGLIECEELDDVVLVGHSYSGIVITGVADRLEQARPGLLRRLVYIDAVTPHPGESWSSQHPDETVAARNRDAAQTGWLSIPPADGSIYGIGGEDLAWVNRRQTPHPFGVYQDALDFGPDRLATLPRTFIDCTAPALATIDVMRRRVRSEPGWQVVELATGHAPNISAPEALAQLLLRCSNPVI